MRGVIAHGVLLVLMLGFAYQTWTRDKTVHVSIGDVAVWDMNIADLQAIELESTKSDPAAPTKSTQRSVRVEQRADGGRSYWWGIETRTDQKAKPAPASSGSAAPAPAPDDTQAVTTKREFPVGDTFRVAGAPAPLPLTDLIKAFAQMKAVRSLGTLTDDQKKDYDLATGGTTLAVIFKGKTRTLILGGKVSGSAERYALDPDSNKAYILAGALIDPIDTGESILRPTSIHGYDATTLDAVAISAGGKTKKASRISIADDHGTATKTWGDAATQKADQTLANFVDNLDKLSPSKYEPSLKPGDMTEIVTVTYLAAGGKKIGWVGLYKVERPGDMPDDGTADPTEPPPSVIEYYVMSEATRVPALVVKATAERTEQDVPTLFGEDASGAGSGATGAAVGSGSGSAAAGAGAASGTSTGTGATAGSAKPPGAPPAPAPH